MTLPFRTIVFDCDSTLSRIEGIDELSRGDAHVAELTRLAMAGAVSLDRVWAIRMDLVRPRQRDVVALGARYVETLVADAVEVIRALRDLGRSVHIVSGGLRPAVLDLASHLGLPLDQVHAVDVSFDAEGAYVDFDRGSPLVRPGGKAEVVRRLRAGGPVALIGDGASDLEAARETDLFVGFGGVVDRPEVRRRSPVWIGAPSLAPLLLALLAEEERMELEGMGRHGAVLARARELSGSLIRHEP